MGEPQY